MTFDDICYEEQLPLIKHLNERVLLYSITLLAFGVVFFLIWIIKSYTFFEKAKIPRGNLPHFPYGNLGDVINQDISLYELLWKYYNRFKRKGCCVGGLYFFTKPVVVAVKPELIQQVLDNPDDFLQVFPGNSHQNTGDIFKPASVEAFLESYRESFRGTLSEKLKKHDLGTVLRNHLLEMASQAFGLNSSEIIDELNSLLYAKTKATLRHNLSLCYPVFKKKNTALFRDLNSVFVDKVQSRKKNDDFRDDFLQFYINLCSESGVKSHDVSIKMFELYSDVITQSYSVVLACLYELSKNACVQDELIGEIRRFNKKYGVMRLEDMGELEYLNGVIYETLRKYPPVPFILKSCQKDFKIDDIILPKGILIAVSVLGLHRSSGNYTNPEEFDPDRFSEQTNRKTDFLPFGCRTEDNVMKLVVLFTKLVLTDILSTVKVSKRKDSTTLMKFDAKLVPLRLSEFYPLVFTDL